MTVNEYVRKMMEYGHYLTEGMDDARYQECVEELVLELERERENYAFY